MTKIDPGLNFWGCSCDASYRFMELKAYLDCTAKFLNDNAEQSVDVANIEFSSDEFCPILYSSFVYSLISVFESQLREIASILKDEMTLDLSIGDLNGSLPDKFRKYVASVAKIDLRVSDEGWDAIRGIYEIRNCLIHSNGYMGDYTKRSVVIKCCGGFGVDVSDDFINLTYDSLALFASSISTFVDHIYSVMLEKYPYK